MTDQGPDDPTTPSSGAHRDPGSSDPSVPPPGHQPAQAWYPPDPSARAPHVGWTAPGAAAADGAHGRPGDPTVAVVHDDGPPPPPGARRRRRNRRLLVALTVLLVVGIPLGLALASTLGQPDTEVAAPDDGDEGDDGAASQDEGTDDDGTDDDGTDDGADPDAGDGAAGGRIDPSMELEAPDVGALDGLDATFAQLLVDIDASEMTMIGFQSDLGGVFRSADGERALAAARSVAEQRREQLLEVRSRLQDPADDADVEAVRDVYVEHLDSWERFMEAVEEDPTVLAQDGRDAIYTLDINATADAFSRALQERLPGGIDAEVRSYADAILDRGFRSAADADV